MVLWGCGLCSQPQVNLGDDRPGQSNEGFDEPKGQPTLAREGPGDRRDHRHCKATASNTTHTTDTRGASACCSLNGCGGRAGCATLLSQTGLRTHRP